MTGLRQHKEESVPGNHEYETDEEVSHCDKHVS